MKRWTRVTTVAELEVWFKDRRLPFNRELLPASWFRTTVDEETGKPVTAIVPTPVMVGLDRFSHLTYERPPAARPMNPKRADRRYLRRCHRQHVRTETLMCRPALSFKAFVRQYAAAPDAAMSAPCSQRRRAAAQALIGTRRLAA